MTEIPNSYKELGPSASMLFLNLHVETAAKILKAASIPILGDLVDHREFVPLGIQRFNVSRASRQLPRPWAATVSEFVSLDVTPCTRSVFASITGQTGAVRVDREDVVSLCVAHDVLRSLDRPVVYSDRLCTREDARFSGDRDILQGAAWDRIRKRDFRADPGSPSAVHRYEACALAWGSIPATAVQAIACKSVAAVERLRGRCPGIEVPALVRADLLW